MERCTHTASRLPAGRLWPGSTLGGLGTFVVLLALLAAACGGGGAAPKVATLSKSTSTTAGQAAAVPPSGSTSALVKQSVSYAQCMQKHGEPGFPDPDSAGSFSIAALASLDRNSPQFQSALKDCQALRPVPSAQALSQDNTALLKFSTCMRSHGELTFPDVDLGSGNAAQRSPAVPEDGRPAFARVPSGVPGVPFLAPARHWVRPRLGWSLKAGPGEGQCGSGSTDSSSRGGRPLHAANRRA